MPPVWIRRVLLAPAAVVLCLGLLVTMPVWLLVALLFAPFGSGRLRALRVLWVVAVYLALEALMLVVMFGLWIGSGFGRHMREPRFQRAHYLLVGWFLRVLFEQSRTALR